MIVSDELLRSPSCLTDSILSPHILDNVLVSSFYNPVSAPISLSNLTTTLARPKNLPILVYCLGKVTTQLAHVGGPVSTFAHKDFSSFGHFTS